jgi:menaquinol-cytochrome c reductase iron-sulfur subunit
MPGNSMETPSPVAATDRRGFLKEAAAGVVGGCCVLIPATAGLVAWLDPLQKSAGASDLLKVASLDALPPDGTPRRVTIVQEKTDAWTRQPAAPVGAIYLRRTGEQVTALHSICPHAGCFVDYQASRRNFFCPCHESTFAEDGSINDPKSPSPRGLDTLEVEVRNGEVWVRFQNFRTGNKEKVPVA